MSEIVDHHDAEELALMKEGESNLARCYLDLKRKLAHMKTDYTETCKNSGRQIEDVERLLNEYRMDNGTDAAKYAGRKEAFAEAASLLDYLGRFEEATKVRGLKP